MLKSLFPRMPWDNISAVGFDLDGTLYDEFDFIKQVYVPVSQVISSYTKSNVDNVYNKMLCRWLEKGSSYPYIYSEMLEVISAQEPEKKEIINQCLHIYRNFKPSLQLSVRVEFVLSYIKARYPVFLVTHGSSKLQCSKIETLGLNSVFKQSNIVISGDYGSDFQKPATRINHFIEVLKMDGQNQEIIYFGDRECDQKYAQNSGFHFVRVYCMKPF